MKQYLIPCILIINIICSNFSQAQDLDSTFSLGKKNFSANKYTTAKNYLTRVVFFDSSKTYSYEAYHMLGEIESQNQNFTKAQLYYDYSYSFTEDTILKDLILIKKTILYLHQHEFSLAASTADMIKGKNDPSVIRIKKMATAANYINTSDFEEAQQIILELASTKQDSLQIEKIFLEKNKKSKSLKKAVLLSIFIPGTGQMYLGDFKNGTNSFILVGSLTFLVINTAIIYNPLSAFLTVFPWWFRYYTGGIKKNHVINANIIAKKKERIYSELILFYHTLN